MKYIIPVLLLFSSLVSFGQNKFTISGTITDSLSGETMIGATLLVKEHAGTGVSCNAYGYYSITLHEGEYTLIASYVGYKKAEHPLVLKTNTKLDIQLAPQSKTLNAVEISAERRNDNITTNKIGVEKIEIKEIQKIPVLFGEQDILKTLQLTPGVKSTGEGNGGLYVRGGNYSQNLILLDEATVYNANHLLGFFSTFNSDAIKDILLYKGTAPAEYGGRVSSVMDIKMNEGNNQKFHVGAGIGLISSRLNIEGPIIKNKMSFLVTGRRTYADLFLKLSSNDMFKNSKLYFYDINAKVNYKINDKNRIFLSGYFGRDVVSLQDRFGLDWGNMTGTLRWNHIWNDKLFSNTSVIYSDYDYRVAITRFEDDYSISSVIRNWNLKHEFQYFANNKNTMSFGLSSILHIIIPGQVKSLIDTVASPVGLQHRYAWENAVYFSNSWKPGWRFNFNYGVRLSMFNLLGPGDFYSYNNGEVTDTATYRSGQFVSTYFNIEPRLNATFIINKKSSIKASYTRNTQNLHLVSNSNSSNPTDIWIASGNSVKPEIADQVSLGYFQNFSHDNFQVSGEVYYKWMQNLVDLKNGAEIRANEHLEGELLFGSGRAYGFEFMVKKKYGKFSGWIAYTLSRTELKINGINDGNWYPAKQDATHDISVVGIYDINDKWSVSATWVYNTGNAVTFPSGKYEINGNVEYYYTERNGYRMPDYHRLDLGVTKYFRKSKKHESNLNISLYNAYGRKNAYTISFEEDPDDPAKTIAVKTYLFAFMPSISYNIKF